MKKKKKLLPALIFGGAALVFLAGALLAGDGGGGETESVREVMQDAVLHENDRIRLGTIDVAPGLISAYVVAGALILLAALLRIFAIPRFRDPPGRLQLLLEQAVSLFDGMAGANSPHRNRFLGAYIFSAGAYIFVGTVFELFGVQAVSAAGQSVSLPAPLSDINGAIAMGFASYAVILGGGLAGNGFRGLGSALKDFSLPISMSFRLFGALLSGSLVTELVYYYSSLSFVTPVIVGVLFTLLHALIQTYVLTMLVSVFYGESSAHSGRREKPPKKGTGSRE